MCSCGRGRHSFNRPPHNPVMDASAASILTRFQMKPQKTRMVPGGPTGTFLEEGRRPFRLGGSLGACLSNSALSHAHPSSKPRPQVVRGQGPLAAYWSAFSHAHPSLAAPCPHHRAGWRLRGFSALSPAPHGGVKGPLLVPAASKPVQPHGHGFVYQSKALETTCLSCGLSGKHWGIYRYSCKLCYSV